MVGLLFLILWLVVVIGAIATWIKDPEKFKQQQRHQSFFHNNSIFSDNHRHQDNYLTDISHPMNPNFGPCGTLNPSSPNYMFRDFGK